MFLVNCSQSDPRGGRQASTTILVVLGLLWGAVSFGCGYRSPVGEGERAGGVGVAGEVPCVDCCPNGITPAGNGAVEKCDGIDNDCNGIVDDDWLYRAMGVEPRRVASAAVTESSSASLAFGKGYFVASVSERTERWQATLSFLDTQGGQLFNPMPVTGTAADTFGGPIRWVADQFVTVWEDRRGTSYDLYLNRFGATGQRLADDVRLTFAESASVQPCILERNGELLVAYADDQDTDLYQVGALRVGMDGTALLPPRILPLGVADARFPRLLDMNGELGLVFRSTDQGGVWFARLDESLAVLQSPVRLTATDPSEYDVVWATDRLVLAWAERTTTVGPAIWAATFDPMGAPRELARVVTTGASMARTPALLSFGDRVLLVWADDVATPGVFGLRAEYLQRDLVSWGSPEEVTHWAEDSVGPRLSMGMGTVGVTFRSHHEGSWQAYFVPLGCPESEDQ